MLALVLTCLAAYLIGSIPFGYLVARSRGVDIFHAGSGNIGATNVGRVLGRKFGILVFVLDVAKGALPVLGARLLTTRGGSSFLQDDLPEGMLEVLAGLAAFLGHLFPVYLRFHGGKGVATGAGVVLMLVPQAMAIALGVWVVVVVASRYVSLASVCAAVMLVVAQLQSHAASPAGFLEEPRAWFCLLAAALVVVRHRGNLVRLAQGRENRLKESPFMFALTKVFHVMCVGLWFGSVVFFSFIVAPTLFSRFEAVMQRPALERPWLPTNKVFDKQRDALDGLKEQGTRAAAFAVGDMFPLLFLLQGACGFAAIASALPWMRTHAHERVHRWRVTVLLLALSFVLAGWPADNKVRALQGERHTKTLAYLTDGKEETKSEMLEARQTFARWHLLSLALNLMTILFVGIAMALTAFLPASPEARPATPAVTETPRTADDHDLQTESL